MPPVPEGAVDCLHYIHMQNTENTTSAGLETPPKGKFSNISNNSINWDDWENLDLAHAIDQITGSRLWADWEEIENSAKAKIPTIPESPRQCSTQDSRCLDGDMEVLDLFDSLRFIRNHITFSFRYRRAAFYRSGFQAWSFRQQLMRDYIHSVRLDLNLGQRDLNVFGTGEESEPDVIHTHYNLSVRNPNPEKLQRILESMRRLVPEEVQSPAYIELTEDSHKSLSYTSKVRKGMPEKEIHFTTGYWKFVIKTKKALGIF